MSAKKKRSFENSVDRIQTAIDALSSIQDPRSKRSAPAVDANIQVLELLCKESGLAGDDLLKILDISASGKLSIPHSCRLIYCLLPSHLVPQAAAVYAVSWISSDTKRGIQHKLLQWLILVYDYLDGYEEFHALYSFIFLLVSDKNMSKDACHLLSLMTQEHHVMPHHVRKLINLQRQLANASHITGLLLLYQLHCPHLVVLSSAASKKNYFHTKDTRWLAMLEEIQGHRTGDDNLSEGRSLATVPTAKRTKYDLSLDTVMLPSSQVTKRQTSGAPVKQLKLSHKTTLKQLMTHIDQIQPLPQCRAVLRSETLQHYFALRYETNLAYKLDMWLHHTIVQEFFTGPKYSCKLRQAKLIHLLIEFSEFLQECMPVCVRFLKLYMCTWNGGDHRSLILQLFSKCSLHNYRAIHRYILVPLRKLYVRSSATAKCQILVSLHELLKHYMTVQRQNQLERQRSVNEGTEWLGLFDSFDDSAVEATPVLEIAQHLINYTVYLIRLGLMQEKGHILVLHKALDYLTFCSTLATKFNIPISAQLPYEVFILSLFGFNVVSIARCCTILVNDKQAIQTLRDREALRILKASMQTRHMNTLLLLFCNTLFRTTQNVFDPQSKVYHAVTHIDVPALTNTLPGEPILHVLQHYAFVLWNWQFTQTEQHRESVDQEHHFSLFMDYLEQHGFPEFKEFKSKFMHQKLDRSRLTDMNSSFGSKTA